MSEFKRYNSVNQFFREKFGKKVIKVSLNGGFTCPNRDGTKGYGGCVFCSEKGSGDFAPEKQKPIEEQFLESRQRLSKKWPDAKYIAYFQSFTNTYASLDYLEDLFLRASKLEGVVGIAIATRPDCIDEEIVKFLAKLNKKLYVFVELGFQTSKKESIDFINRCYENKVFEDGIRLLNKYNIDTVVHTILGLPYESKEDMLNTIRYVSSFNIRGIKLQLLHILENTALAKIYKKENFKILSLEEYVDIVVSCIEILPKDIVIHRITGDGDKKILIEPKWSLNKKVVLNSINKEFLKRDSFQGKFL